WPGARPLTSTYGPTERASSRMSSACGPRSMTDTTAGSTVPRDPGARFLTTTRTAGNVRSAAGSIVTVTRAVVDSFSRRAESTTPTLTVCVIVSRAPSIEMRSVVADVVASTRRFGPMTITLAGSDTILLAMNPAAGTPWTDGSTSTDFDPANSSVALTDPGSTWVTSSP